MTKADIEAMLVEVRDGVRVLRNEAVETRRVLKLLVGVLNDMQVVTEGLRQELHHTRTSRERAERAAQLAAVVGLEAPKED
jgi:hypothetical protein